MSGVAVEVRDLIVRYGSTQALSGVNAHVASGAITGVLGRNGAGKSSLLATIAAFRRPSSGQVLLNAQEPFENPIIMAATCLVRESGDFADLGTEEALRLAANAPRSAQPSGSPAALPSRCSTRFTSAWTPPRVTPSTTSSSPITRLTPARSSSPVT